MKQNNQLNKALHEALRDHPEPLHEAQWKRLRADLDREKKKRFPWFFFLTGVIILASVTTYMLLDKGSSKDISSADGINSGSLMSPETNPNISNSEESENASTSVSGAIASSTADSKNNHNSKSSTQSTDTKPADHRTSIWDNSGIKSSGTGPAMNAGSINSRNEGQINSNTINPTQINSNNNNSSDGKEDPFNKITLSGDGKGIEDSGNSLSKTMSDKPLEPGVMVGDLPIADPKFGDSSKVNTFSQVACQTDGKKQDTTDSKKKGKNPKGNEDKKTRIILGITGGFSMATTRIIDLTNQQYFHKDTKKVFEENNKNQTSTFFNFSFEYKFKHLGLRFNSGLQYRSIHNNVNYIYRLNEVPWRNIDNTIDTYYHVKDSAAMAFMINSKQSFRFVTIPVQLSYGLPLGNKYELIFNAGLNISALVGAKGNSLDLVNYDVSPISSKIKQKFTFGYTGGFQVSRNLYDRWWLGIEANFGTVNLSYNLGYGDLKSRIINRSLSLQLRYKL